MPQPPFIFDVFLSHNSKDKPAVEEIARILRDDYGLKPWLDKWERIPGTPWQEMLEEGLNQSETVAVFLGEAGFGRWENEESRVAVNVRVTTHQTRVIPVLLPGAPANPELPMFLSRYTWVDLRNGYGTKDLLFELFCGITGTSPGDREAVSSQTLVSNPLVERFRDRAAPAVSLERHRADEILQQHLGVAPRRELPANSQPRMEEGLQISRSQLTDLIAAQSMLKDYVDGHIKFSEPWVDCGKAYSKLRALLERPAEDISSPMYWNDIKTLLRHAKSKSGREVPDFLRLKNEVVQFNEALDNALHTIDTVLPKTTKSKKMDVISDIHDHLENAAIMAEAIVEFCQQGATTKLTEISGIIKNLYKAEQAPSQEVSSQSQKSYRSIDRLQGLEDRSELAPDVGKNPARIRQGSYL